MSISTLRADASQAEIEDEIVFYEILLQTLDMGSEEYDEKKAEYDGYLHDLEQRLENLRSTPLNGSAPQTPASQRHAAPPIPGSGSSLTLPSREAERHRPTEGSPLQGRSNWGWPKPDPSQSQQKRARNCLQAPQDAHKRSRNNDGTRSTSTSRASTPNSLDSLERVDRDIEKRQRANPVRYSVLARMKEQERTREARAKAEQDDMEYARSLSMMGTSTSGQPSSSTDRTTQSFFRPDGRFAKPSLPASVQAPKRPQAPSFDQHGFASQVKREADSGHARVNNDAFASYAQQKRSFEPPHIATGGPTTYLDDYDDEVQYLGSTPGKSFSKTTPGGDGTSLFPPSRPSQNTVFTHHGGSAAAYPSSSTHLQHKRPSNPYSVPGVGYTSSANNMTCGDSVYSTTTNSTLGLPGFSSLMSGIGANSHNPIDLDGSLGYTSRSSLLSARSYDDLFGLVPGGFPEDLAPSALSLESQLHARGLESMLNDPARSKEDLEKLIENIRPDEDLPPELRGETPKELRVPLMEHQKLGLTWLQRQEESSAKGGILADDMGLGKTIQALALIATRPSDDPARKTTLIVAPVALLRQWQREINERIHSRHKLTSMIYHGQARGFTFSKLSQFDIVITTFGKLASEVKRKSNFEKRHKADPTAVRRSDETLVLLDAGSRFYRIIVDEAQNIKNHNAQASVGALYVDATYRLCMTGTPMMNNVGELFSLIRFLRIPPYNSMETFNRTFKRPLEGRDQPARAKAMKAFQVLCKSIMLRRTKASLIDGKPILNLLERTTEVAHAVFDESQEAFYRALEMQTQLQMSKFLEKGKSLKNYSYILVRLLRLRQACDHPHLIQDRSEDAYADVTKEEMTELAKRLEPSVVERIKEANGAFECPICYDAVENPSIFFPCGHDCCPECFSKITDPSVNEDRTGARCPECRNPLDTKKIIDFRSFKKVFMPGEEEVDQIDELFGAEEEDGTQSESCDSDTESEDDDDDDSQGDLRDFIVKDEDPIEEESPDEEDVCTTNDTPDGETITGKAEESSRRSKGKEKITAKDNGKGKNSKKSKGKKPKKDKTVTLAQLKKESSRSIAAKKRYLRRLRKTFVTSAKIEKTGELINMIAEEDPTEKIIIFSQFTTFLDLLEVPISEAGYKYRRYDGAMSAKLRNDAVMDFQDRKMDIKIILVSLKAGNAGLNLTAGSQVILLDPFWNPFIEEQAIDRAHRIGQSKPVRVHRVLVENTVEDRILALQEKKRELINTALDESASKNLARLGRAELRYLFGLDSQL